MIVLPCFKIADKASKIAQLWGARRVIGVDLDETLIRAAWKRRRMIWSLQGPEESPNVNNTDMSLSEQADYFPASCEHMFGPLPIPPHDESSPIDRFPHNVAFQTADWTRQQIHEDEEGYDVVVA